MHSPAEAGTRVVPVSTSSSSVFTGKGRDFRGSVGSHCDSGVSACSSCVFNCSGWDFRCSFCDCGESMD